MLVFVYDAMMNGRRMAEYCPGASFFGPGYLLHYELVFDGESRHHEGAVASIRPKHSSQVWGGVYGISQDLLRSLDRYEDRRESESGFFDRRNFEIVQEKGVYGTAVAYYCFDRVPGLPHEKYLAEVLQGARDCRLPDWYIFQHLRSRASV